jgi:probable HAF family extracellular repeat protein
MGQVGRRVLAACVALGASFALWTTSWSQRLTWLGTLGGNYSYASGVSADGSVVVGMAVSASDQRRAFRWTASGGMQDLVTLGGNDWSYASGVSADGSVVVGTFGTSFWYEGYYIYWYYAFRWTAEDGMQDLGTLGGDRSEAYDVSADGSVVVGYEEEDGSYQRRAFRWTASGGMQNLGTLTGYEYGSEAYGVSDDGAVVVGYARNTNYSNRAFRWTAAGGMQDLGTLGGVDSGARGVSADGSVVVGASGGRAFRWTAAGGMRDLGTLPGYEYGSYASGVSADGAVVVGRAENASGQLRAIRWTAETGMQDLNQLYAALLQNGSVLSYAYSISPDGRYIVGQGRNAATGRGEAYLLDTWRRGDTNGDGCIDDSDLLAVLFAFGTPGTGLTRHEDINKDGIVDDADLLEVLFAFGQGC